MFKSLFKGSHRPDALDLIRHRPEEFPGKIISLSGRDYRVGVLLRQNNQGFSYGLKNTLSNLAQHIIQIRPEYLQDPQTALRLSLEKAKLTAALREGVAQGDDRNLINVMTVCEAHGGSFELHEMPWGALAPDRNPRIVSLIEEARAMMSDPAAAVRRLDEALSTEPQQTVAINLRGVCYSAVGDHAKALAAHAQTVEIEPNFALYKGARLISQLNTHRRMEAAGLFADFKASFPFVRDYDYLGVHAYLRANDPARAAEQLERSLLTPDQGVELAVKVTAAVNVRRRFLELDGRVSQHGLGMLPDEELIRRLRSLFDEKSGDAYVDVNLGLALRRHGDYKLASDLLMSAAGGLPAGIVSYCWANAAYCQLAMSQWAAGMALLSVTVNLIRQSGGGRLERSDLPYFSLWLHLDHRIVETMPLQTADFLDNAIRICPDPSLVTPEVTEMASMFATCGRWLGSDNSPLVAGSPSVTSVGAIAGLSKRPRL